jgi:hypothetical protein
MQWEGKRGRTHDKTKLNLPRHHIPLVLPQCKRNNRLSNNHRAYVVQHPNTTNTRPVYQLMDVHCAESVHSDQEHVTHGQVSVAPVRKVLVPYNDLHERVHAPGKEQLLGEQRDDVVNEAPASRLVERRVHCTELPRQELLLEHVGPHEVHDHQDLLSVRSRVFCRRGRRGWAQERG